MINLVSDASISNQSLKEYQALVSFVIQPAGGSIKAQTLVNSAWVTIEDYTATASIDILLRGDTQWRFNITGSGRVDYYYYAK
tara:strand:+ start:2891 stop:3139 length:249 start_codon:yes stop_codon:yes gene_type:complete